MNGWLGSGLIFFLFWSYFDFYNDVLFATSHQYWLVHFFTAERTTKEPSTNTRIFSRKHSDNAQTNQCAFPPGTHVPRAESVMVGFVVLSD